MMKAIMGLALLGSMSASAAQAEEAKSSVHLYDIEARLLYEESGTLSDDITAMKDFVAWNTIIAEGSAKEPATDILVAVVLNSGGEVFSETPLTIRALGDGGKVLFERTFASVLVDGTAHQFLYLKDATCEGEITLEAKMGDQSRSEMIELFCGE